MIQRCYLEITNICNLSCRFCPKTHRKLQSITAEQFEDKTRTKDSKTYELLGLLVNFADYSLGATKGGEITHFQQFDINFNQEVSLLETRCSGSLTRPFSAIALETEVTGG